VEGRRGTACRDDGTVYQLGIVDRHILVHVHDAASIVRRRSDPLGSELPLERDIPCVGVRCRQVIWSCNELSSGREHQILVDGVWKWIPSKIALPGADETAGRAGDRCTPAPWIRARLVFSRDSRNVGITERVRGPDRGFPIAFRIECESEPWVKVRPLTE